jgi:7-cyano-7-deazaguanine synthase
MHGIKQIALATLANNPFTDATERFFALLEEALSVGISAPIQIMRPFSRLSKEEVMRAGRDLPLQHTFSCIAPAGSLHCGACNKCAERKSAFEVAGLPDPTRYAAAQYVSGGEPAVH